MPRALVLALLVAGVALGGATAPPARAATPLAVYRGGPVVPDGDITLVVQRDGRGRVFQGDRRKAFTLADGTLARLKRELRAARFSTLKPRYRRDPSDPPFVGAQPDRITHAGRTVRIDPGVMPPKRLARVRATLTKIVDRQL